MSSSWVRTGRSAVPDPLAHAATLRPMNITLPAPTRAFALIIGALALTLALLFAPATPALADGATDENATAALELAAEERERRPIAPTQRDQFGLLLYTLMALSVVAGIATMRRQLKGERPQTDGEFRWR